MSEQQNKTIGLPWYRREDYDDILNVMEDRHSLAPTYTQWLVAAENNVAVAQQVGLQVMRVLIEPASFVSWCAQNDIAPDSKARTQFANEQAKALT